jgi:hypothetical protein
VVGLGFMLAAMWAGFDTALYGFFIRVSTDSWPETIADVIQKAINYFPLIALPFACKRNPSSL